MESTITITIIRIKLFEREMLVNRSLLQRSIFFSDCLSTCSSSYVYFPEHYSDVFNVYLDYLDDKLIIQRDKTLRLLELCDYIDDKVLFNLCIKEIQEYFSYYRGGVPFLHDNIQREI